MEWLGLPLLITCAEGLLPTIHVPAHLAVLLACVWGRQKRQILLDQEHTCNSLGMCCLRSQDSPVRKKKWMSKGTVTRKDLAFLVSPTLYFGKYLSWEMPSPQIYILDRNLPWGSGVGLCISCGAIMRTRRGHDWSNCAHPFSFYPLLHLFLEV